MAIGSLRVFGYNAPQGGVAGMVEYLFAYGTLLLEHAPPSVAPLLSGLTLVGEAVVAGRLYDLGLYPGATVDDEAAAAGAAGGAIICGKVFAMGDAELLRQLDDYEGFMPGAPDESLFIRRRCVAKLGDGGLVACWIYVYNRDLSTGRAIPSGRYSDVRPPTP